MRKKTPALVNLAIYTTITIFLWIFFDIYRALKKPPVIDIDQKTLEPVDPKLNDASLNSIKESIYFDEDLVDNQTVEINSMQSASNSADGQVKE